MEPSIEKQEREKLIDEAWGGSVHPYTQNIIDVRAASAVPLTEAQTKRLREKLEAKCKKHVELTVQTDPTLLGGIRLELPDRQLDGSVQSHLSQIQQLLESSAL